MLLGFACAYSVGPYFPALQAEFSASRASVSSVFALAGALYFFIGALSGPLSDKYGSRWVSILGLLVIGVGMAAAGLATSLDMVYWGFGLGVGIGVGFSYVPAVGAVQPWFTRRRGFASGLAVSGIGVGTLFGPLLASALIDAIGWRQSFIFMGIGAATLGVLAAAFLENDPDKRGGVRDGPTAAGADRGAELSLLQAMRTGPFWRLFLAWVCISFALFIPFVHLVPFALDHGMSATLGASVLGVIGVGSTFGRFVIGSVADRLGRILVMAACFLGIAVMMLWWLMATEAWMLIAFGFVFGSCYGGFVALAPAVCVDYFGTRAAGAIIGVLYSGVGVGTFIGPPFAGYVFDQFGSYQGAITVATCAALMATVLMLSIPLPEVWLVRYRLRNPQTNPLGNS
jgi:MFS family permease